MPGLRQRRGAVSRERARVQVDLLGRKRALQHALARAGIDTKPAARRRRIFFLEGERDVEHVTRLVAELEVGAGGRGQTQNCRGCQERPPHRCPANRFASIDESEWRRGQGGSVIPGRRVTASPESITTALSISLGGSTMARFVVMDSGPRFPLGRNDSELKRAPPLLRGRR